MTCEELEELFKLWAVRKAFWQAESNRIDEQLRRFAAARRQAVPPPPTRRRPKPLRRGAGLLRILF
jgi:hypothetical protein